MHRILTTALLLSAGTALAIADSDSEYTTTTTGSGTNYGGYSAWTIVWGGSDTSTVLSGASATIPDSVSLESISVSTPSSTGTTTSDVKLAIYTVSEINSGGTTDVLDSFVGLSTNSTGSWSTSSEYTFSFDGITLTSGTRYTFVFVSSSATADELAASVSTYAGVTFRCNIATGLTKDASGDLSRIYSTDLATYWSGYAVNATYITTVAVPEPSSFGLLAGLGALALVASRRRRRSRKAA